jgi:hypothetical protein
MEAASQYIEATRQVTHPRPGSEALTSVEREDRRASHVREIGQAALLVHSPDIQTSVYQGVEALRLHPYLAVADDWEPRDLARSDEQAARSIRELAAGYLREDAAAVSRARVDIQKDWEQSEAARLWFDKAGDDEGPRA